MEHVQKEKEEEKTWGICPWCNSKYQARNEREAEAMRAYARMRFDDTEVEIIGKP